MLRPILDQLVEFVFNRVLVNLLQAVAEGLRKVVGGVLASDPNFVTQTPPGGSYASRGSGDLGNLAPSRTPVSILVVLGGGLNVIVRDQLAGPTTRRWSSSRASRWARCWSTRASRGPNSRSTRTTRSARRSAGQPAGLGAGRRVSRILLDVLATLVYLVTSLLLVLQMLMRLALVDVLLVVAPLGLLCWVLPQSRLGAPWSNTLSRPSSPSSSRSST